MSKPVMGGTRTASTISFSLERHVYSWYPHIMTGPEIIPDEQLPDYCWSHCRTDAAYFHESHINRLLELAGLSNKRASVEWGRYGPEIIDPVVLLAKNRRINEGLAGYKCVQHGGSPTCEDINRQLGLTCPICQNAEKEEKVDWKEDGF